MAITSNIANLTRTQIWSSQLKEILKDELMAQGYVRWLTDFPDGNIINIPSIGEATVRNYTENAPIVYDSLDTGNFQFSITEYKQSGIYITKKAQQDLYYAQQLEAGFVPKQARALAEEVESNILALGCASGGPAGQGAGQTASNANLINGAPHRIVGGATYTGSNYTGMATADFAKALFSLKKANVPDSNLVAIVDPSVEYQMNTMTNLINQASATTGPLWGDLIQSGIGAGVRFVRNIYGFDVYVSNYLGSSGPSYNGASETIGTTLTVNNNDGVVNLFMSLASPEIAPFIGAWRQEPEVDSEYNKDFQRWEYLTTARYGLKLYRPESLVTILTSRSATF
jgi:hypothetical protein